MICALCGLGRYAIIAWEIHPITPLSFRADRLREFEEVRKRSGNRYGTPEKIPGHMNRFIKYKNDHIKGGMEP